MPLWKYDCIQVPNVFVYNNQTFPGARPQNNELIQLLKVGWCENCTFSTRTASRIGTFTSFLTTSPYRTSSSGAIPKGHLHAPADVLCGWQLVMKRSQQLAASHHHLRRQGWADAMRKAFSWGSLTGVGGIYIDLCIRIEFQCDLTSF